MRRTGAIAALLGLLSLMSCGAAIDNALGINGDPSMNSPMSVEGNWQGRLVTGQNSYYLTTGANITLQARGEAVTGRITTDEGRVLQVRGQARAGASHTGLNTISAEILSDGSKMGYFRLTPGGSNRIAGNYTYWSLDGKRTVVAGSVSLNRIRD